ncbi:MAG: PepSY domain-containing protein [Devosia sp.]
MFPRNLTQLLLAIVSATALLAAPAGAQGLGLGLDLGGIGVDLGVGGENLLDLDVDIGDEDVIDLGLGNPNATGSANAATDPLDALANSGTQTLSQDAAMQAVRRGSALPLDEIMLRAALIVEGEVIDAQLIAIQDTLLYELKVLATTGKVSDVYFYARSGLPVE